MTSDQIQLKQIQAQFKDAKCPVVFADAPTAMWCADGVMHLQYRAAHLIDPAIGSAEFSPVVEVVLPISAFYLMHDASSDQIKQLEKQGIKRIPMAAVTPTAPSGGPAH